MNLPHLLNIRRKSFIMEPLIHGSKVFNNKHHNRRNEAKRGRQVLTSLLLEDLRELIVGQLIASQRDRTTLIIPRIEEDLCRNRTNITASDHLQRLPLQRHLEGCREHFAHEVWGEIVIEAGRAKNRPIHLAVFGLFDEVLLDIMLVNKVGDISRVVE